MIINTLKKFWHLILTISAIGGAYGFYVQVFADPDYAIAIHLKSSDKVIENNSKLNDLKISFNDREITSLYLTKIQIKNSGKRALTNEFIYEPLTIKSNTGGSVLKIDSNTPLAVLSGNAVIAKWELFNPGDALDINVFSTEPLRINLSYKIREVSKIYFVDEITNPPADKRIQSLNKIWLVFMVLSIFMTVDGISLVRWDVKGSAVLGTINSLSKCDTVDKKLFLDRLRSDYEDYYKSAYLLIKPDELIDHVSSKLPPRDSISGPDLEVARSEALKYVMHGNLYTFRSSSMFIGPLIFGLCALRIAVAFVL